MKLPEASKIQHRVHLSENLRDNEKCDLLRLQDYYFGHESMESDLRYWIQLQPQDSV